MDQGWKAVQLSQTSPLLPNPKFPYGPINTESR